MPLEMRGINERGTVREHLVLYFITGERLWQISIYPG